MKCERCEGLMQEERLFVSGGMVLIKEVSVWHCLDCGRTEYRTILANRFILAETEPLYDWDGLSRAA
jgi:hypothetical protein